MLRFLQIFSNRFTADFDIWALLTTSLSQSHINVCTSKVGGLSTCIMVKEDWAKICERWSTYPTLTPSVEMGS